MKKKYFYILLFSVLCNEAYSQNYPQFTQYIFNQFYLNPGATGQSNRTQVQASVRSQYTGYLADFDAGGSNLNSVFSVDMPLTKLKGGLGFYIANNQFSKIQSKTDFQISYAYHKKIRSNVIGFGLSFGSNNLKLLGENYRPRDENDPIIPSNTLNSFAPNLSTGVYLYNPSYSLGVSVKNLLEPSYKINEVANAYKEKRTYLVSGKYDFGISYTLDISPMFMVKSDLQTVSTEIGAIATYNQQFWGGINYRWQDAASALIGGNFLRNTIKIGYSIDIINFGVTAKSSTSHEIFLRYSLIPPKFGKKSIIKTPRYNI